MAVHNYSRGWLLSGFLILEVLLHLYSQFVAIPLVFENLDSPYLWFLVVMPALGLVRLASVIAVWFWHLWGFYLFTACTVAGIVLAASVGISIAPLLYGVAGVVVLFFLLRRAHPGFFWPRAVSA
jgi:hypothetical protein